jgi:hypothetical protein
MCPGVEERRCVAISPTTETGFGDTGDIGVTTPERREAPHELRGLPAVSMGGGGGI